MPLNLIKKYSDLLEIQSLTPMQRIVSLEKIFKRDIEENINFKYSNKPIYPSRKQGQPTMETLFNHLTTEEDGNSTTKSRCFDIHRSQRLHWIKHHVVDNSNNIDIFSFVDRVRSKNTIRTYLYDKDKKYVIILEPRTEGVELYYLITAYYLNRKYGVEQIDRKMREKLPDVH